MPQLNLLWFFTKFILAWMIIIFLIFLISNQNWINKMNEKQQLNLYKNMQEQKWMW